MSTAIELKEVCVDYKIRNGVFNAFTHQALTNISLSIQEGETFGILGRNGSGKSTLLQVIAGLIKPSKGTVDYGRDYSKALLTLGLGFRPDLTGADNAMLSLVLQGKSRKESRELLPLIAEFAEVGAFFNQAVKTYSAGMRARLGFATALTSNVDILIIDEVLSVGDLQFRKKAENAIANQISGTKTVIFVSQSPHQVAELCTRAAIIDSSKIIVEGRPETVAEQYLENMSSARVNQKIVKPKVS